MKENREIFALDDESMEKLTGMAATKGSMRFLDPKNHIGFDIFSEDRDEPVQT
jgi:alcohol dehydrogenase (NADP+)